MKRMGFLGVLVVALTLQGLVPACSMKHVLEHETAGKYRHDACVTCHRTNDPSSSGGQPFAGGIDPSSVCLDCHHYDVNHHPVDVAPSGAHMKASMNSFPLFDGKIRCLTCHQAHVDPGHNRLKEPPKLLRGAPYADRREICFQCHYQEKYAEINPHKMLNHDGSVRDVNGKPVCLLCHTERPAPEGDPEEVKFRADVAFLCWRCHAPMESNFLKNHFHVKPKKNTRVALKKAETEQGIVLPLAIDGMITCSTCHNPHQKGIAMRSPAAAGSGSPLRLRIPKEALCKACHPL